MDGSRRASGRSIALSRTEENYLRAIAALEKIAGYARIRDIASELRVKSPTATQMVQKLAEKGLAVYKPREGIKLSKEGKEIAEKLTMRYEVFLRLFRLIGIPDRIAFRDACAIEHYLHAETAQALRKFLEKLEKHPDAVKIFVQSA